MLTRSILLAAALVATTAVAQDKPKPAENTNQPPTADTQKPEDPKNPDSYGYGEQPGGEATRGAKQATHPDRAKSKMPQDQRPTQAGRVPEKPNAASVAGQVVEVSPNSVSVRGDDQKVEQLQLTAATVILREGQPIDASRLRPGDEVRAAVQHRGEQILATRITVESGDAPMQQGTGGKEPVDTPDQAREGIGGHIENTHPDPEPEDQGQAAPSGRP